MEKYKIANANMLKLIAILAMTIDHIAWMLFPGYPKDFGSYHITYHRKNYMSYYVLFYSGGILLYKKCKKIHSSFIRVCVHITFCLCICVYEFCGLEVGYSILLWQHIKSNQRYVVTCMGVGYAADSE